MFPEASSIEVTKSKELPQPCPFKSGSHNGACTLLCPLWIRSQECCAFLDMARSLGMLTRQGGEQ